MNTNPSMSSDRASQSHFRSVVLGLGMFFLLLALATASRESFSRDDFAFLAQVQRPDWSWFDVYFPVAKRWWWAYRPLGMDSFFYLGFELFGLHATGYFAVIVVLSFATAFPVYGLMRRLSFEREVAALAALLAVTRYAVVNDLFYGSIFHYVAAGFLAVSSLDFFIDFARSGSRRAWAWSMVCFVAGLLCNESVVVYPAVFFGAALYCRTEGGGAAARSAPSLWQSAKLALPFALVGALWALWRFAVIADVGMHAAYLQSNRPLFVARNVAWIVAGCLGGTTSAAAVTAVAAAVSWTLWRGRSLSPEVRTWWLRVGLFCALWTAAVVAPFARLYLIHERFSRPAVIPLCVLLATCLNVVWIASRPARRQVVAVGLVALALLAFPYGALWRHFREPVGQYGLALVEAVGKRRPEVPAGASVQILYNAPGLASHAGGIKFRTMVQNGAVLHAYYPRRRLRFAMHDLWRGPVDRTCSSCVYFQLEPDLDVAPAEERFLDFGSPFAEQ